MLRRAVILCILLLLIPLAYPLTIKDLLARYSFSVASQQFNVTGYTDFMTDENANGINDTLVFELETNNMQGTYVFVINLFDKNGVLTNETKKNISKGINKINLTLNSIYLSQNQFNYSIKIYNSSHTLKYRKDNIPTQIYQSYEEGFKVVSISDYKEGKTLKVNVTINSSVNGTFEAFAFLSYNTSVIHSKEIFSISDSLQNIMFNFNNETIRKTHHAGPFELRLVRIGKKNFRQNWTTSFYDFSDFASQSYISGFSDEGVDEDNDNKFEKLRLDVGAQILVEGNYTFTLGLYDLFDGFIDSKTATIFLSAGQKTISFTINGSRIYDKKLDGPYVVKYTSLYYNGILADQLNDAFVTNNYRYNDFVAPNLPDLDVSVSASDSYHYGINNLTVNVTIKNTGYQPAFNVFIDIFDNNSIALKNKSNILNPNSQISYIMNLINASDFEFFSLVDINGIIEELNESNNAEKIVIRINKAPVLIQVTNITANEMEPITVNLTAFDPNEDSIDFLINSSKFLAANGTFFWNTTSNDSGRYHLMAIASDGFLNDSIEFDILVKDTFNNDLDNDGINDTIDNLIGDAKTVNTSTIALAILINDSANLSKIFSSNLSVKFLNDNATILEFPFDFSKHRLNLTNMTIEKQSPAQLGSLLIRGLIMPKLTKLKYSMKTMYVDKVNATMSKICIKDEQISDMTQISPKCKLKGEVKISCNGKKIGSYRCKYMPSTNKYKVDGLKHSGIVQTD